VISPAIPVVASVPAPGSDPPGSAGEVVLVGSSVEVVVVGTGVVVVVVVDVVG
jgi:hypothetical protein